MTPARHWLTFDCFGTLVDWEHGIATTGELLFPGWGQRVLQACAEAEPRLEAEYPEWRYRRVLRETLCTAAHALGLALSDDDASMLARTLPSWPVFPDARPALWAARQAGWKLGLLTNCDRDLIAGTLRRLQVPFDLVVTAEDAGSYKPALGHFRQFVEIAAPKEGDWVHVAQSHWHDILPAAVLGVPRIWVNRKHETRDRTKASMTVHDLSGLLAAVQQVRASSGTPQD